MDNYIFGKKAIIDAIKNNKKISLIKCIDNYQDIIQLAKQNKIEYQVVNSNYFKQYEGVNHQNIIAYLLTDIKYINQNEIAKNQFNSILILDGIESPQNFGSIIRSAAAFGIDLIVFKNNNQAPINDLVIKTSMGAINYVTFCKVSNINQLIDLLKKQGYWIYGAALADHAVDISRVKFDSKSVIIVGNENRGINQLTLSKCDFLIKIEINNLIESLNVSVATGIILHYLNINKPR